MDVNAIIATAETMEPAPPVAELTMPAELVGYEDEQDPAVRGGWQIETTGSADWALRRLGECEAEAEEIHQQAEAARAQIAAREAELTERAGRGAAYFRFKLAEWAETHRDEIQRGKKKSRDFIHGRIGFRKKGGRLVVNDAAELEGWLLAQPVEAGLYRLKVAPEMKALQERFKATGEIPPGCDVEPETESIHIEATAPEAALAKGGK